VFTKVTILFIWIVSIVTKIRSDIEVDLPEQKDFIEFKPIFS
jgi:hypothetical protein